MSRHLIECLYKVRDIQFGRSCLSSFEEIESVLSSIDNELPERQLIASLNKWRLKLHDPVMPKDPFSDEYREYQLELFKKISKRNEIPGPETCLVDLFPQISQVYPYATEDPKIIGSHMLARGFWLSHIDLDKGSHVVEMGAGQGFMSVTMASAGYNVTAIDIVEAYNSVTEHLAKTYGTSVKTVCSDMLNFTPKEPADAVIFCESFHHCNDPVKLIEKITSYIKPEGKIYFFAEPITIFPVPWGIRLDGQSIWAARVHGWLELGFNYVFFKRLMKKFGWKLSEFRSRVQNNTQILVASR